MGPDAFRTAGLDRAIEALGHRAVDLGNVAIAARPAPAHPNAAIHHLAETIAWAEADPTEPESWRSSA